MPGPVIPNPTPDWLKPENASVTDTALTKAMRMIGHLIGADNPTAQVLGLMMTDVPGGSATGGLAKAVEGLKARVIKAYHGTASQFEQFADPVAGKAVWFTKDPAEAARYSEIAARGGGKPKVLAADVELQRDGAQRLKELSDRPFSQAVEQLKHEGYDGFTDGNAVAVFQGGQAKIRPTIQAYHGSPHDFERFSLEKIGTGEGAQAYGHGLYFAENPAVAEEYKRELGLKVPAFDNKPVTTVADQIAHDYLKSGRDDALTRLDRDITRGLFHGAKEREMSEKVRASIVANMDKTPNIALQGKTYEVAIHADPEDFLDWDKPLSQQSEKVRSALGPDLQRDEFVSAAGKRLVDYSGDTLLGIKLQSELRANGGNIQQALESLSKVGNESWKAKVEAAKGLDWSGLAVRQVEAPGTGQNLINDLQRKHTPEGVNTYLKSKGIPGIKYLDQGSRSAGEGSRNYVVFDDRLIDILKKYGLLLPATGAAGEMTIGRRSTP